MHQLPPPPLPTVAFSVNKNSTALARRISAALVETMRVSTVHGSWVCPAQGKAAPSVIPPFLAMNLLELATWSSGAVPCSVGSSKPDAAANRQPPTPPNLRGCPAPTPPKVRGGSLHVLCTPLPLATASLPTPKQAQRLIHTGCIAPAPAAACRHQTAGGGAACPPLEAPSDGRAAAAAHPTQNRTAALQSAAPIAARPAGRRPRRTLPSAGLYGPVSRRT